MNAIAPLHSGNTRIVIADDHVLVAQGLERLLMECFPQVDVVSGGQALLEYVREKRPDLVITDLSMPDLSGLEVMRQLHREDIRSEERRVGKGGRCRGGTDITMKKR